MEKYLNGFCNSHLRTLQRRVSDLRDGDNQRGQKYQELMVNNKLRELADNVIYIESATTTDSVILQ